MVAFKLSLAAIATIIGFGAGTARADLINKTAPTDNKCHIFVRWTWNPETTGPLDDVTHESTDWKVHVKIDTGSVIKVDVFHKSKCHIEPADPVEDEVPGDTWVLNVAVPGISQAETVWNNSQIHNTNGANHYDNYKFKILRNGTTSENRLWVIGDHSAIDDNIPALGPGGVALFGLLLLAGGGVLLKRSRRRGARGSAS